MSRIHIYLAGILCLAIFTLACASAEKAPTAPAVSEPGVQAVADNSYVMGMWDLWFDEGTLEITPVPLRASQAHLNLTDYLVPPNCYTCVGISVLAFDPVTRIVEAQITLNNPWDLGGYDVRGIVYTGDAGHVLLNDDAWTGLHDIAGGQIINPFRAFDKNGMDRSFPAYDSQSEVYRIWIPAPPHDPIKYAITASYPANCDEPYAIENFSQGGTLSPEVGAQVTCTVDVLDWQNDVNKVVLNAPEITGEPYVDFTHVSGSQWSIVLVNSEGAPVGQYKVRIAAYSANSGIVELNKYAVVTVTGDALSSGWARALITEWWANGTGIDVDANGNSFECGTFSGTVDFDPGPGTDYRNAAGTEYNDVYLTKLDWNGMTQWTKVWGGELEDQCIDVEVDDATGAIFVGYTVDGSAVKLARLDSNGDEVWSWTWPGLARKIAISDDYVFASGLTGGTVDFDPGPGVDNKTSGSLWTFTSCFDMDGNYQWAYTWDGFGDQWTLDVCADSDENSYMVGQFNGEVDFDSGPGEEIHSSTGGSDVYLLKLGPTGEFVWARTWGGSFGVSGASSVSIATDNLGSIYVAGGFDGECDFDPSDGVDIKDADVTGQAYLSKFSTEGDYMWNLAWGSGGYTKWTVMAVNSGGDVYVSGIFWDTPDLDPGIGVDVHDSGDVKAFYLSRFDSSGNFIWAKSWGGVTESTNYVEMSMATDISGTAYIIGPFNGTHDFNPGDETTYLEGNGNEGVQDIFIEKILPSGTW